MIDENKLDMKFVESTCMEIICNAGEGRAHVYEALEHCLKEEYDSALEALNEAETYLQQAHNAQFSKLMKSQLDGKELPFNIIILHAMDLLMVATAERDMLKRIVMSKVSGGN